MRFVFCAFRAGTQSLTHDEAVTYLRFASGPWENWFTTYDANNHVLNTLLERVAIGMFGSSEISLRLPSLIGGLLFSIGSAVLLRPLRSAMLRWVGLFALLLHPLLLDFSVAARGYSLALASVVWAFVLFRSKQERAAGLLLGIGIAANLTTIFPALAMMGAVLLVTRRLRPAIECLFLMVASAGLVCYLPLRTANRGTFYVGIATFAESIYNLTLLSLRTNFESAGFLGTATMTILVQSIALPLILVGIVFGLRGCTRIEQAIPAVALWLSLAGIILAHIFLGMAYPVDRTGLWLITLFLIAWVHSADCERRASIRNAHILVLGCLCAQFVTQVQTRYFIVWAFDAHTKEYASHVRALTIGKSPFSVGLSSSVSQQPAIEYYRRQVPLPALKPVERQATATLFRNDFYLLANSEIERPGVARLTILSRDDQLGALFAKEPR